MLKSQWDISVSVNVVSMELCCFKKQRNVSNNVQANDFKSRLLKTRMNILTYCEKDFLWNQWSICSTLSSSLVHHTTVGVHVQTAAHGMEFLSLADSQYSDAWKSVDLLRFSLFLKKKITITSVQFENTLLIPEGKKKKDIKHNPIQKS